MKSILPGISAQPAFFIDERGRPDFQDVFRHFVRRSTNVATAVTRVRISTLDLDESDFDKLESMRVLVAELNALTLDAEARLIHSDRRRAPRVDLLRRLLEEGRLEVRSAPLGGWSPDFTVFGAAGSVECVLAGFHWFERPYPHRGPALASVHFGDAARLASRRHAELWEGAHDVGSALWSILSKAQRSARLLQAAAG